MSKRKNVFNPNKINNYNKFLSTLDNYSKTNTENNANNANNTNNINNVNNNLNADNTCNNNKEKINDKEFEDIINRIKEVYEKNNDFLQSTQFTGLSNNDIIMSNIQINDPNNYKDFTKKNKKNT